MNELRTDYLVIGSGMAGLWFAFKASQHGSVIIVTKKEDVDSNTNYAQGGIAAAVAEDDSPALHYEDTIRAGAGLAHPDIVKLVTESGPSLVRELAQIGIEFSTYTDDRGQTHFDLGQEGGHRRRRIIHARDLTGAEIEAGLLKAVHSRPRITVLERHIALDLLLAPDGTCIGASVFRQDDQAVRRIRARVTLLATGGIGRVYLHTTNPPIATGDGIAMAYRAGARIANMEFIQFHPTALYGHMLEDRAFLISEALRGEGAILRTKDGRTFMECYHPDASLAPRDVVARAIAAELTRRHEEFVLLDATQLPSERLRARFPNIYQTCLSFGLDITQRPIPVVPAAHYVCGGVAVNSWAETSIPGLAAAGECACTGLHGANRLASNSLLEALVFADRAAERARHWAPKQPAIWATDTGTDPLGHWTTGPLTKAALRKLMWDNAGIVRSDAGLRHAEQELAQLAAAAQPAAGPISAEAIELKNLITIARLIVACAIRRKESRGLHYNIDHPEQRDEFQQDTIITRPELEATGA